jgi:hypothetical protein
MHGWLGLENQRASAATLTLKNYLVSGEVKKPGMISNKYIFT